jgi:hypothetical protein
MAVRSQTQRTLLFSFIGSISFCGLVGIYCLLLGRFSSFTESVLATTATIGGASILGLAAAVPWERRKWHPIGPVAMLFVVVAAIMLFAFIWLAEPYRLWRSEGFMKSLVIACILAVAGPHAGLLSLARLRRSYEWVRVATAILIALLTGLILAMILAETDDDLLVRLGGILGIGVACGTIAVPILHRVSAIAKEESIQTTALELSLTCPRCSTTQTLRAGRSQCGACGLRFRIEIEEEHCEGCGYVLYRLESAHCPECGRPIQRQPAPVRAVAGSEPRP